MFSLKKCSLFSSLRGVRYVGEGFLVVSSLEGIPFIASCQGLRMCFGVKGCLLVVLAKILVCLAGDGGVGVMY